MLKRLLSKEIGKKNKKKMENKNDFYKSILERIGYLGIIFLQWFIQNTLH